MSYPWIEKDSSGCVSSIQLISNGSSGDMIRVKMCHAENIDRFKAKSRLFDCNLGSLTAIDQQTAPIISEHK